MKRTINSRDIDKDIATSVAKSMLDGFDGIPMEHTLSYLNGVVIALARFIKEIKANADLSDDEGLEKLVLSWLSAVDPVTGLKFSKFISTDCIDINFNEL